MSIEDIKVEDFGKRNEWSGDGHAWARGRAQFVAVVNRMDELGHQLDRANQDHIKARNEVAILKDKVIELEQSLKAAQAKTAERKSWLDRIFG